MDTNEYLDICLKLAERSLEREHSTHDDFEVMDAIDELCGDYGTEVVASRLTKERFPILFDLLN